ncbi:MAG TPA: phage terminase large subunit [Candidatus Saccharimonadales bacterium]|nr:phage terminase large subunit [Candidatus Saccharimonadales bacterium]
MPTYNLKEGSVQYGFQKSRAKIQIMGGGFGNGKTTAGVIKALQLAKEYPGSNGLIARSTFPKLNDTIRKEFYKWCPTKWIERKVTSQDNVCELKNGTVINFRYIQQHGKNTESTSSNLLSATYDWIVVDQIEDPEITEKDFLDLLGRLRGNTKYDGEDRTMPHTGPRWLIVLCNPTRNWVYRKLVKPLQDYHNGIPNENLMVDGDGNPVVELFEGSTYTNKENLPPDFIETLEAAYQGQMRERYLLGNWGAFEGLVYPQYEPSTHVISEKEIYDYLDKLVIEGFAPNFIESYDHGIAKPACYGLAFVDHMNNMIELDGFYHKEKLIDDLAEMISESRNKLQARIGPIEFGPILADPAVFRRVSGNTKTVGVTAAGLFQGLGIDMMRANNDVVSGIAKVQSYLAIDRTHRNPFTDQEGAPHLYFNSRLSWIDTEITDYYWKKDTAGEYEDVPMDRNDHAMDRIKYALTHRPRIAQLIVRKEKTVPRHMRWRENSDPNPVGMRRHRYAA